jgi:hypothetical protein
MVAEFCLRSISFTLVGFFNMQQNITTWDRRRYSLSKESRSKDFLSHFHNNHPRQGLNLLTLDPMPSTLTTIPQRATNIGLHREILIND